MVKHNIKNYITTIILIAILTFLACCMLELSIWDSISYSISITSILVVGFVKFAWKWKIFRGWLVPFPNLNGYWDGIIKSTYKNACSEIPIKLKIKQTFLHIQIRFQSKESKSNSIVAAFNIDEDRGIVQLCYSYQNDPKATLQKKSPIHYGSVILDINEDNNSMNGQYWTTRNTTGEMYLEKQIKFGNN